VTNNSLAAIQRPNISLIDRRHSSARRVPSRVRFTSTLPCWQKTARPIDRCKPYQRGSQRRATAMTFANHRSLARVLLRRQVRERYFERWALHTAIRSSILNSKSLDSLPSTMSDGEVPTAIMRLMLWIDLS